MAMTWRQGRVGGAEILGTVLFLNTVDVVWRFRPLRMVNDKRGTEVLRIKLEWARLSTIVRFQQSLILEGSGDVSLQVAFDG